MATNQEGGQGLKLPSGTSVVLRPYGPAAADAIGDVALDAEGTNYDKALSFLIESLGGKPMPKWHEDQRGVLEITRGMLLNDYLLSVFLPVAAWHEGVYDGNVTINNGKQLWVNIPLLDKEGKTLERFTPAPYPMGNEKQHEWAVDRPDGKYTFRINMLDGEARAKIVAQGGAKNANDQLLARLPRYSDPAGSWTAYNPKDNPPGWIAKEVAGTVKRIDPVINFAAAVPVGGGATVPVTMFAVPDFFLRDFM